MAKDLSKWSNAGAESLKFDISGATKEDPLAFIRDTSKGVRVSTAPKINTDSKQKSRKAEKHKDIKTVIHKPVKTDKHKNIKAVPHKSIKAETHKNINTLKHNNVKAEVHKDIKALKHKSINNKPELKIPKHNNTNTGAAEKAHISFFVDSQLWQSLKIKSMKAKMTLSDYIAGELNMKAEKHTSIKAEKHKGDQGKQSQLSIYLPAALYGELKVQAVKYMIPCNNLIVEMLQG